MHLILIGLRGSGKTTVGPLAAGALSLPFTDLDHCTARRLGSANVRDAWEKHGQTRFREAEAAELAVQLARPSMVLSLGGGTPTAPGAADMLRAAPARIVYLRASPDELRRRLSGADPLDRPPIHGGDPLTEIERVWRDRDPLYRELASCIIEVAGLSPQHCAELAAAAPE